MSGNLVLFPGADATARLDRRLGVTGSGLQKPEVSPGDRAPQPQRIAALYARIRGERHRKSVENFILDELWIEKSWPDTINL